MQRNQHLALLILRLTLGFLLLLHGVAKISGGVEGIGRRMTASGLPEFFAYGVYVGEVIAPLLLIVGYRTRLAALVFSFNMLVAALLAHADDIFSLNDKGAWAIELIGLYFFGALALFFSGGGKYALSTSNRWD